MSGALCASCQAVIDNASLSMLAPQSELVWKFGVEGLDLHNCRLCAIIWTQDKREQHLQNDMRQNTQTEILKISYSYDRIHNNIAQALKVVLHYPNDRSMTFAIPIISEQNVPKNFQWRASVSSDTVSSSSIQFLGDKMRTCLENHVMCQDRAPVKTTWHPTRLLNMQVRDQSIFITLVDGEHAESAPYVSLSHCWGGHQPLQLNASAELSLRRGRQIDDFPKTFRDAIYICTAFNIPYLWIDSLCIFQDSPDDKAREISAMHKVYMHAFCNIAATSASNCTVGLSFRRYDQATLPFWVKVLKVDGALENELPESNRLVFPPGSCWFDATEEGPLNKRSWVLQENQLSTRIMHFTQSQVLWECYQDQTPELYTTDALSVTRNSYPLTFDPGSLSTKICIGMACLGHLENQKSFYGTWALLVHTYTKRSITHEADKLPAITGLFNMLSQVLADQFIAGFWRSQLPQNLVWFRTSLYAAGTATNWRSQVRHAPTWSWASYNIPVRYRMHQASDNELKAATTLAVIEDISADKIPVLTLQANSFHVTLYQWQEWGPARVIVDHNPGEYPITGDDYICALMDDPTIQYPYQKEVVLAKVYEVAPKQDENGHIQIMGLILKATESEAQRYERIGAFWNFTYAPDGFKRNEAKNRLSIHIV